MCLLCVCSCFSGEGNDDAEQVMWSNYTCQPWCKEFAEVKIFHPKFVCPKSLCDKQDTFRFVLQPARCVLLTSAE